ncbi:MAG: hypothetical protein JO024_01805 [Candidatus Eremiobacteraeota bacterium]|nr:hypothetical protein [Candidatus Eremiobacteraeota bacterium]
MTTTPMPQYRVLRGLLLVLAILAGIGGLVVLFDARIIFLAVPTPAEPFAHSFIVLLIQGFGAVIIGMAILLYAAARDPVRYISVIDAFIVILVLLSGIDVYAAETLHLGGMYPGHLILGRVAFRLILAIVLLSLRPRAVH